MNTIPGLMINRHGVRSATIPLVRDTDGVDCLYVGSPAFGGSREVIKNAAEALKDDDGDDSLLVLVATGEPDLIDSYFLQGVRPVTGRPTFLAKGSMHHETGAFAGFERLVRLYPGQSISMDYCDGSSARITFEGGGGYDYEVTRSIEQGLAKWTKQKAAAEAAKAKVAKPVKFGEPLRKAA